MPLAAFPKCYLNALIVDRTMTLEEWIESAARELDVDGLEFYWGFTPASSMERQRVRKIVEQAGLSVPMMCYSPDFIQPDPIGRAEEIRRQQEVIVATAELGGRLCRVLSGQRRPGVTREDGLKMAADAICELIPFAANHGVCLILENHYKDGFWEYPEFAQRKDDFLELLARIPEHPSFGVNYDPSNALIAGDDPIELLQAVKRRVVSMHASDRFFAEGTAEDLRRMDLDPRTGYAKLLRHGVIGRGCIDYPGIFSILRDVGFKGWISIEDGDDPTVGMTHLRESADFLRRMMAAHGIG